MTFPLHDNREQGLYRLRRFQGEVRMPFSPTRPIIEIVLGGCSGTDALAERYAHSHGYPLQIFPADWSRYGKRAGYARNREMHAYISTFAERGVIAFWDGTSKGTAQSFALAKEFGNPNQGSQNR